MDSSKIKVITVIVLAAWFAVYLGMAAATAQTEAIGWVAGIACLVGILALGKNVWVLIPIFIGIEGGVNALPGSPPIWWLATLAAVVMQTLRFVMRSKDFIFRFSMMDFAILLQVIAIGQAWILHPAGFSILGGDTVGGKQNFLFALSFVAYAMLAIIKTDLVMVKRVAFCIIFFGVASGALYILTEYSPTVAVLVLPFWSGGAYSTGVSATGAAAEGLETSRFIAGAILGKVLGLAALTLFVPISLFNPLKFGRFSMFMLALAFTLISGFRSAISLFLFVFVAASLARRRPADLVLGAGAFVLMLSLLIVSGSVRHLPFGAQRILSSLPVEVSDNAKLSGEDSSEWRFEMWRVALSSDRYIKDKIFGDGFGYSAAEQRAGEAATAGDARSLGGMSLQEVMMVRGAFHGFHVETIRCTGVIGLLLALISMGMFLRTAWTLINYYRGRPEWMYVLYLCVPFLVHPFYKMLVWGAYRGDFPLVLVAAGMLKVLDNIRFMEQIAARAPALDSMPGKVYQNRQNSVLGMPLPESR